MESQKGYCKTDFFISTAKNCSLLTGGVCKRTDSLAGSQLRHCIQGVPGSSPSQAAYLKCVFTQCLYNANDVMSIICTDVQYHIYGVAKLAPVCDKALYYHTPVPILRLRKYGIVRPCIYFDVTSLALYKHSVKTC
jgi:hypothetical protein